jgi:hypothetical protein
MSEEKDKPAEPQDKRPEQPKLTHEEFVQSLRDRGFIVHKPSGEGVIITGQNPAHPKPK